jgi:small subunit ribosomal protein S7
MRRRKAKSITVLPDPKFNEVVVTKFVNNLMYDGKKNTAYKIFYDAIEAIEAKLQGESGLDTWKKA